MKESWLKMYKYAKEYYNKNHHLKIQRKYITEDGIKLGIWICNQRMNYKNGKLDDQQIKLLNDIGMLWKIEKQTWEEMYLLAQNYFNHYKHLKINKDFITKNGYEYDKDGLKLGIWIQEQRKKFKANKLSKEKKEKLEKIGMIWKVNKTRWDKMYKLAEKYYKHYGNLKIPKDFKTKDGYTYDENGEKLGIWISNQRYRRNINENKQSRTNRKLTNRQIFLLDQIDMIWDGSLEHEKYWDKMYKLASKYYSFHRNLVVPIDFKTKNGHEYDEKGVNLGRWIRTQRMAYRRRTSKDKYNGVKEISEAEIKKLNNIGMVWNINEARWMEKYLLVKIYYKYYGNLKIPYNFKTKNGFKYDKNGINIYNWLARQRKNYKDKKIEEKHIELLNEINMEWEINPLTKWYEMYNLAKVYYEHYGNININAKFKTKNGYEYDEEGKALGRWVRVQKERYQRNIETNTTVISEEEINLLNELNITWKPKKKIIKEENILPRQISYEELVAKINLLNMMNAPLIINGHPHPMITMNNDELIKNYNISLENLIYNFYSEEKSEEVKEKINKNKVLIKRF